MTTTPDLEADLVAKLAALLPGSLATTGSARNLFPGPERPTFGVVPTPSVFVMRAGEFASLHSDGQYRQLGMEVVIRSENEDYLNGEALARAVYDAAHLLGKWTGASGQAYDDVRAVSAPVYLGQSDDGPHYWQLNLDLWAAT